MPKNTRVERCYKDVLKRQGGEDKGKAARICQHATGQALATGRKPKGKK